MCFPSRSSVGLLKQLLVQQLGLTEKNTQEEWIHSPRCHTASPGLQADSDTHHAEKVKAHHPGEGQAPFRTGTGDISSCHSPRTSADSSASRDSVALAFHDRQASHTLAMDHVPVAAELLPAEPEGGPDESGEHFFDAREAHSDDIPPEADGALRKEEDVHLRISGNYLILDGYEAVQESSTDEEIACSFPPLGSPSTDPTHQPQRSPSMRSEGALSPFTPECLVPTRWGTGEEPCFEVRSPSLCADPQGQIMRCILKIEADLEHLKKVEESYTTLCQKLAGSALLDKHADKS